MPPQSINPFERKKQPIVKPVDPEKHQELLAKVAGKTTTPNIRPAVPIPGITGVPPLPTGKVVGHIAPSDLTDIERQTLEAGGWTPDIALPTSHDGLKQLQAAIESQVSAEVPLPYDPRNPPKVEIKAPVRIESLPPEKQQQINSALAATIAGITSKEQAQVAASQRTADMLAKEGMVKGSSGAMAATEKALEAFRKKVAEATETPVDDLPEIVAVNSAAVNAMKMQTHFAEKAQETTPEPKAQPQAQRPAAAPVSETGAAHVTLTHCPHCEWDLSLPDVPAPSHTEKLAFLQCILGMKPFSQETKLFSGTVSVVFRTLTTREVDTVTAQCFADQAAGKCQSELDYYERFNRYRLFLQIQTFKSNKEAGGMFHELPDGYSPTTNPNATGFWVTAENEGELSPGQTGLPDIEGWMIENVLKTENIFRVVNRACNSFNRLVGRIESLADNKDFI